jgi:large subunit ribosomal protein L2
MSQVKIYKPTTAARRHTSVIDYNKVLTPGVKPSKKLIIRKKTTAGRSNGKITVRHKGGGYRKLVRQIDFKRNMPLGFKVNSVEYDPNRSAFICLVTCIKTGDKKYVLHSKGMEAGKKYQTDTEITSGNKVPLSSIPVGTFVSQIEVSPNKGATMVRSAGTYAIVTAKEEKYTTLKLPSGEIRKFLSTCSCIVNRMGNEAFNLVRVGKAGRTRHKGVRPTVRGKVMNPVDHPHGGGEARNSIGMKYPKTPWGKHALGVKTRNKKKMSSKVIVTRRNGRKY